MQTKVPMPILRIEKRINAEPARLFRAWLEPKDFSRWFLSGVDLGAVHLDPRPGGRFRIEMISKGKILPHEGEYRTIEEPSKIVFTWRSHATGGRDTLVTVTFTPVNTAADNGSGAKPETLITLVHEQLESETEITSHTQGWTNILASLETWQNEIG
ncbi:MAG: SRPBCC domain-containing protein [Spirochaetia bacterium]|nr:SRPBCC domain-containing protein [Spirochaetia bacterium]